MASGIEQTFLLSDTLASIRTNSTNTYTSTKPSWATDCFIIRTQGSNYVTVVVKEGSTTLYTFPNDMTPRSYYAGGLSGDLTFAATDQYSNNSQHFLLIWR